MESFFFGFVNNIGVFLEWNEIGRNSDVIELLGSLSNENDKCCENVF